MMFRSSSILTVGTVALLLALVPLWWFPLGADAVPAESQQNAPPLQGALRSTTFTVVVIASLVLSGQLLGNAVLDYVVGSPQDVTRLLLLANIIGHDVLVVFVAMPAGSMQVMWVALAVRDIVYATAVTHFLRQTNPEQWTPAAAAFQMVSFCVATLTREFDGNMFSLHTPLGIVSIVGYLLAFSQILWTARALVASQPRWVPSTPKGIISLSYVNTMLGAYTALFVCNIVYGERLAVETSETYLIVYTCMLSGFTVVNDSLHSRLSQREDAKRGVKSKLQRVRIKAGDGI